MSFMIDRRPLSDNMQQILKQKFDKLLQLIQNELKPIAEDQTIIETLIPTEIQQKMLELGFDPKYVSLLSLFIAFIKYAVHQLCEGREVFYALYIDSMLLRFTAEFTTKIHIEAYMNEPVAPSRKILRDVLEHVTHIDELADTVFRSIMTGLDIYVQLKKIQSETQGDSSMLHI